MKKIFFALFFVACCTSTQAQVVRTSIGFGFNQSFGGAQSLNFITERYNETRSYLDNEMGKMNTPSGITAELGFSYRRLYIGFEHTRRRDRVLANGIDATNRLQCREVERQFHTFGGDIGYRFPMSDVLSLIPGVSLDLGKQEIGTRLYPDGEDKPDFTEIVLHENTMNVGYFCKMVIRGTKAGQLIIEPYFTFGLDEYDLTGLNEAINPGTWTRDGVQTTRNNISGIKFMWAFVIGGRK